MRSSPISQSLTIGRLARAADVGVETIRYYQDRKLLPVPESDGAFRYYPMGLIERIYVAGSRREHFRMRDNAWTTLYSRQHSVVDEVLTAVERGVEVAGSGPAHRRLVDMRDFYSFLISEAPALVERFERLRAEQRRGESRP